MAYKSILLFGAPGSGKGTQGKVIGAIPGFKHLSTGDMFRALDRNSELGRVFLQYSTRGELVPDDFTVNLFIQHIEGLSRAGQFNPQTDILLLDGIPRSLNQAKLLADKIDVLKVVYLACTDMTKMIDRLRGRALKENRPDDADEKVIQNRLQVYDRETRPVLDFYPKAKVATIDATLSMVGVLSEIVKVLVPIKESLER